MKLEANDISLKELIEKLFQAEQEYTRQRFDDIKKQFEQQEKNVAFALASQKELSQNVANASDKAITKAEEAQKQYNQGHNDLSRKMEDQYKEMLPRKEADERQKNQEEKLEAHRGELSDLRQKIEEMRVRGSVNQPLVDKSYNQIEALLTSNTSTKGKNDWIDKVIPWLLVIIFGLYEIFKPK